MKNAILTIKNHEKEVAEFHLTEIPDDQTEAALRSHYNQFIKLFMRHLGSAARIADFKWL
jgi:hypothetical protein